MSRIINKQKLLGLDKLDDIANIGSGGLVFPRFPISHCGLGYREMRLRKWRQEKGLDAQELAFELRVSPSWVSKIERGLGRPKPSLARRIAAVLGRPYIEVWRAVNEDYVGGNGAEGADGIANHGIEESGASSAKGRGTSHGRA